MADIVSKYNIMYVLYMAGIVSKYNITYVLYMAISHGIFFKVSIFQYYYIVSEVQYNVRTYFIWLILCRSTT